MNVYDVTHSNDSGATVKPSPPPKNQCVFFCSHFQRQKRNYIICDKIKIVETHIGNYHIVKCLLHTFIISHPYLFQPLLFQWFSLPLS